MNFNIQHISVIALLLLFGFMSSCNKENINDELVTTENPTDTLYCDVTFDLVLGMGGVALETISINNLTGGTPPYSYLWNTGDTTQLIIAPVVGTYSATVTDANNCTEEESVEVDLNTIPCDSTLTAMTENIDTIGGTILTTVVNGGTPPFTYLWSTGESSNLIIVTDSIAYFVTVTDGNNCSVIASNVTVITVPCDDFIADIIFTQDSIGMQNLSVDLIDGIPPYMYSWSTGEMLDVIDVSNTIGNISVTVTDINGCEAIDDYDL